MRAAFRVDASDRMGTGHVMRCLTLADALREVGIDCFFIHRCHPGSMTAVIRQRGFEVYELPEPESDQRQQPSMEPRSWLGVSMERDAEETAQVLKNKPVSWLIVDHYVLDAEWEEFQRPHAGRIAVLDDLANRSHACELLLDQNHLPAPEARYAGLLPPTTRLLCGARYALLRPEFAAARARGGRRSGPVNRVLVFYGGADPNNETGRSLRVLSRPEFAHLAVDVVIGANHPNRRALMEQAAQHPRATAYGPQEHLVDLMVSADLALGAGGTTTWERCVLGLPSIVVTIAANQREVAENLAREGALWLAGDGQHDNSEKIAEMLGRLVKDPGQLQKLSDRAAAICDGFGAQRAAKEITCMS